VIQNHAEYNGRKEPNRDRTPWNIQARSGDERVVPSFRTLLNVRYALMPYIWQEAQFSAATGQPMMRAARLYDAAASEFDYFFGRDLFVSPVVTEGAASWEVRLPEGIWRDLWTGTAYSGGKKVTVDAPLDRIPVFVREGAVVPVRLPDGAKLGDSVPFGIEATGTLVFD
jgi:alpha-glucosidase (family GH31 glycosyl hydrolase)